MTCYVNQILHLSIIIINNNNDGGYSYNDVL